MSKVINGTAQDTGGVYAWDINNSASGVNRTGGLAWQQGKAQVLILRDENDNTGPGPVTFGCGGCADAGVDYYWNGTAWVLSQSGPGYSLNAIWGKASNDIYAVGSGGTVLHYDGSAWTEQSTPTDRTLFAVMTGPDGVLRAVGADGVVLRKQ